MNSGKLASVLAYIGPIGWIIGLLIHQSNRTYLSALHLRQALGLFIMVFVLQILAGILAVIPLIGVLSTLIFGIASLGTIIYVIVGILRAIGGNTSPLPIIGYYIEDKLRNVIT